MRKFLLVMLLAVAFSSCSKEDEYDAQAQLEKDERVIKEFIAANDIQDAQRDDSGIWYVISDEGSGNITYSQATVITANYKLRLLSGEVLEESQSPFKSALGGVITGWQIGIPKIQKGGKIRLLVPSLYAYGPYGSQRIQPNTPLDFDIELLDATN